MKKILFVLIVLFSLCITVLADDTEITDDNNSHEYVGESGVYESNIQEVLLVASGDIKYSVILPKYASNGDKKVNVNPYTITVTEGADGKLIVNVYRDGTQIEYDENKNDAIVDLIINNSHPVFASDELTNEYNAKTTITVNHEKLPSGIWTSKLPLEISLSKGGN